jgi:hypothetical protein
MRKNRELLTTGLAALTLLATITAPLCGPLCARDKGCSAGMALQGSEGADCHHGAMAKEIGGPQTHFVAAKPCASTELPAAILDASKNWYELRQIETSATASLHAVEGPVKFPSSLGTDQARWRANRSPFDAHENVVRTIALRI